MKIRTQDLIGPALDWAVAECKGRKRFLTTRIEFGMVKPVRVVPPYSSSWSQGGPIIEREISELYEHKQLECWAAKSKAGDVRYGPTPLIAIMRCYVASKLGDEVDVPDELLEK